MKTNNQQHSHRQLFNRLYISFPNIRNKSIRLDNIDKINHYYYSKHRKLWFARGESENKYYYLFDEISKPLSKIEPEDVKLIVDFSKTKQYCKECIGILSEDKVYINVDNLKNKYPEYDLSKFTTETLNILNNNLNVINLGRLDDEFVNQLEYFIRNLKRKDEKTSDDKNDRCEICENEISLKRTSEHARKIHKIYPELCPDCIEKIIAVEFYEKISPYLKDKQTKTLEIPREKIANDKIYDYGLSLIEKYNIISYIGIKKLYFSFDNQNEIIKEYKDSKYNLLDILLDKNSTKTEELNGDTKRKMNLFLNSIEAGKTDEKSYSIAKINENIVESWLKSANSGDEKYTDFYDRYYELIYNNKSVSANQRLIEQYNKIDDTDKISFGEKYTQMKMNVFLETFKRKKTLNNSLKSSNIPKSDFETWIEKGKSTKSEYYPFKKRYDEIINETSHPKTKESKNDKLMHEFIRMKNEGKENVEIYKELKIPRFLIKNWRKQGEMGNKKYAEFYEAYIREPAKPVEDEKQSDEPIIRTDAPKKDEKTCSICGRKLNKKYQKDICKRCLRKQYAANTLQKLLQHIDVDIPFKKEDLKKLDLNEMQVNDYIWTLQEFSLITETNNNKFQFKPKDELDEFIKESGVEIIEINTESKIKLSKTCKTCGKTLEISKFFTSEDSPDGYEDNCKDCKKLANAASYLNEIIAYVNYGEEFSENDLLTHFKDPFKLQAKLWTLMDNDLVKNNIETNTYQLTDETTALNFLNKYLDKNETVKTNDELDDYNSDINAARRKIFLENIKSGHTDKLAAVNGDIKLEKIKIWLDKGSKKINPYDEFYTKYQDAKRNAEDNDEITEESTPDKRDKKDIFIENIENGKSKKEAAIAAEIDLIELNNWLNKGSKNISPHNEFYKKYIKVKEIADKNKENEHNRIKDKVLNLIVKNNSIKDAAKLVDGGKYEDTILNWYISGKSGDRKHEEFYLNCKIYSNESILKEMENETSSEKKRREQMEIIIDSLLNGDDEKTASKNANISYDTYKYWINRGKQSFGPIFKEFYKFISKIDTYDLKRTELNDKSVNEGILKPLPDDIEKDLQRFSKTSRTGFAWVNKIGNRWIYSRTVNKKIVKLSAPTIEELYKEVIEANHEWGVRDIKKAKLSLSSQENENESESETEEIKNIDILTPLPDKYERTFKSKKTNKTGIAWVNKIGNKWIYSRRVDGEHVEIKEDDIYELYNKVVGRNLVWGIRDYNKANIALGLENDEKIHNILAPLPPEYEDSFAKMNKSGIAWVNFINNKWKYQRTVNGKEVILIDDDLHNLYNKVVSENQVWGIRDIKKAKICLNENKLPDDEENVSKTRFKLNINYFAKDDDNIGVIISGKLNNNTLIEFFNNLQSFESNIDRIMVNRIDNKKEDVFIELTINNTERKSFEDSLWLSD